MQEIRHDGSEALTPNATVQMFEAAIREQRNASVALHKPGAVFVSDGKTYRVGEDGALEPMNTTSSDYQAGLKQGCLEAMAIVGASLLQRRKAWEREAITQRGKRLHVVPRIAKEAAAKFHECVIRAAEDEQLLAALGIALTKPPSPAPLPSPSAPEPVKAG